MFLRYTRRFKDGKEHRYWSIVENHRGADRRVIQRQVLYLGEINDSQKAAWCRSIEVFESGSGEWRQKAPFPAERPAPGPAPQVVRILLRQTAVKGPRPWGAVSVGR